MDNQAVPLPFPLSVSYWAYHEVPAADFMDGNKMKLCETHPELPWVIAVDKHLNISIWDYAKRICLKSINVSEIVSLADKSDKAKSKHTSPKPAVSFVARRSAPRVLFSAPGGGTASAAQLSTTAPHLNTTSTRTTKEYDEVHRVCFVDRCAIQWSCDVNISSTSSTFHSGSRIMIVCSAAILFYDFITHTAASITTADLGKTPSCAEFVYTDLCAIGCNDGQIRIWDCNSWSTVKSLSGHPKGDLIALRNLLPHSSTSLSATLPTTSRLGSAGSDIKEGRMRLLSIGADGSALIWDSAIVGNIITIPSDQPTGHLLSQGSLSQHLDGASDTLYTVSGDRTIRIWDLSSIRHSSGGAKTKVKPGRRASITLGVTQQGSLEGRVPCVGKVKPSSLPASLAKYTTIVPIDHPSYPVGTFAIAAKTNTIGIVVIVEASLDDKSEKSSIRSSTDLSQRLLLLHEIPLPSLLAAYNVENNATSTYGSHAASSSVKIYSLSIHPIQPHLLLAATSVGIVVCNISQHGKLIGSHMNWTTGANTSAIFTYTDKVLRKSNLKFIEEDINVRRSVIHHRSRSVSRPPSGRVSISVLKGDIDTTTTLAVDVLDEVTISDTVAGNAASLTPQKSKKPPTLSTSTAATTSQPHFHVSISGAYVALVWPESMMYIVYRIAPKIVELDRGQCYHFAWTTTANSTSNDAYVIVTPMIRIETGAKPKKFQLFTGKMINENVLPSLVVLKVISDGAGDAAPTIESFPSPAGLEDVSSIFAMHGGRFMCVTRAAKVVKKALAISQIELEAMKGEVEDDAPEKLKYSSQFMRLENLENKFSFVEVGVTMSKVEMIEWSINHVAVVIDTRINLLAIEPSSGGIALKTIASVELGGVYPTPQSLVWWHDFLFITTATTISMVVMRKNEGCGGRADVFQLASLNQNAVDPSLSTGEVGNIRPYGFLEAVTVVDGYLIISSRDGYLLPVSLSACPLATIALLSSVGAGDAAGNWFNSIPSFLHDSVADICINRNLLEDCLKLSHLSSQAAAEVLVQLLLNSVNDTDKQELLQRLVAIMPFPPQGANCVNFPPCTTLLPTLPQQSHHYGSTLFDVASNDIDRANILFDRMMSEKRLVEALALALITKDQHKIQSVAERFNLSHGNINELLGSDKFSVTA